MHWAGVVSTVVPIVPLLAHDLLLVDDALLPLDMEVSTFELLPCPLYPCAFSLPFWWFPMNFLILWDF